LANFNLLEFVSNNRDDNDTDRLDGLLVQEDEDRFAFRNYVYTFSVFNSADGNLDGDNIPARFETAEGVQLDFYDTDNDGTPDYLDSDDDNDGILTGLEIEISDLNANVDSDCDGTLNNDNNVQFIYTDLDFPNEDKPVAKFIVADINQLEESERVGQESIPLPPGKLDDNGFIFTFDQNADGEVPFHLDNDVQYNEDNFIIN